MMADPISPLDVGFPAAPLTPDLPPAMPAGPANDAQLRSKAQEFEAMFLTEMLRLARPTTQPAGPFGGGFAEESWQMFMDQALGQAMAARGGTGLEPAIEAALRRAQAGGEGPMASDSSYGSDR